MRSARRRQLAGGIGSLSLGLVLLALLGAAPAAAQMVLLDFGTDVDILATRDLLEVRLSVDVSSPISDVVFECALDPDARYVEGSGRFDGQPLEDWGGGVSLAADRVDFHVPLINASSHELRFSLRAVGPVGARIDHRILATVVGASALDLDMPPTPVEDENASRRLPNLIADSTLLAFPPNYNTGIRDRINVAADIFGERRSLLQFNVAQGDFSGVDLVDAWLELHVLDGHNSDVEIFAHPVRVHWEEGSQVLADCTDGVSWSTTDCSQAWTHGGDFDPQPASSAILSTDTSFLQFSVPDLVRSWDAGDMDNHGVELLSSGEWKDIAFYSKEGAASTEERPELHIVEAPEGSYASPAVSGGTAEIVPTSVGVGVLGQRFVYTVSSRFDPASTGLNQLALQIGAGFNVSSLDSVLVDGVLLSAAAVAGPGQYEIWDLSSTIDLRFGDVYIDGVQPRVFELIFHADTPLAPNPLGVGFSSSVDHDRRGYPAQANVSGNANGGTGGLDGDTWTVVTKAATLIAVHVTPADTTIAEGQTVQYHAFAEYSGGVFVEVTDTAWWYVSPANVGQFNGPPGLFSTKNVGSSSVHAEFDGMESAGAGITVTPAVLVGLRVQPDALSTGVGSTANFRAWGDFSDGGLSDLTNQAAWSINDSTIATLVAPGAYRGLAEGGTFVWASKDAISALPAILSVVPADLVALDVTPADTTIALGRSVQMHAWGTLSDLSVIEMTDVVEWTAGDPAKVSIGADGIATAVGEGVTTVGAQFDAVFSSPVDFTVVPADLLSLDGEPDLSSVPAGITIALSSTGFYSDGGFVNLTSTVLWESLDPLVADLVGPGQVRGLTPGTARIAHSHAGVVGDTLLVDVAPVTVVSVDIVPCPGTLPVGAETQLAALAQLSDASQIDVTLDATWLSSDPAVANVSAGLIKALLEGNTQITATVNAVSSAPCDLTVDSNALDLLVIAPADTSLALGDATDYRAWGTVGPDVYELTTSVDWSVIDTDVATIDGLGHLSTQAQGSTTVEANLGLVVATPADLSVSAPDVVQLEIFPSSVSLLLGRQRALSAIATLSDASSLDVSALASWSSDNPGVAFVDASGVVSALGLGSAMTTASYGGVDSDPAEIAVLPSVRAEALAAGQLDLAPGSADALLMVLRLRNSYLTERRLDGLRFTEPPDEFGRGLLPQNHVSIAAAADWLHLYLDDGDGEFVPGAETELTSGRPEPAGWTVNFLDLPIAVGAERTLFLTADLSLDSAAHGDTLDVQIVGAGDLFWNQPTAVVGAGGFPLNSTGQLSVRDLIAAQIDFTPTPADTVVPGELSVEALTMIVPDDGGRADELTRIELTQLGTARSGADLSRMRLQIPSDTGIGTFPKIASAPGVEILDRGWIDVSELVHVGGGRWLANGFALEVPPDGAELRVIVDIAATAEMARTIQLALPAHGLEFLSGRQGPIDVGIANSEQLFIDATPTVEIRRRIVFPAGGLVARDAIRLPVLGLEVEMSGSDGDTLTDLRLRHSSVGPDGAGSQPHVQVSAVELWHDVDLDGSLTINDTLLTGAAVPDGSGNLVFSLAWPLRPASPQRLLVTLTPDPAMVRDAERLAVSLSAPGDVTTAGGLPVQLVGGGPLQTISPPTVDGQSGAGYGVVSENGGLIYSAQGEVVALDFQVPPNGYEDDVLEGLILENAGTATVADVAALRLYRDDGDGILEPTDALVGKLETLNDSSWRLSPVSEPIPAATASRFLVGLEVSSSASVGRSFLARLPGWGVQVASDNDGPIDGPITAGQPWVIAVSDVITWVAGVVGSHAVAPDAARRPILVLESFNGYTEARTLTAIEVDLEGSHALSEIRSLGLAPDLNGDGEIGADEPAIAVAVLSPGKARFEGFEYELEALTQQRLIVSYSLDLSTARDGSTIDAALSVRSALGFLDADVKSTVSTGDFPLDSPGIDTIDGLILKQLSQRPVISQTLGGGETEVLALDLWLPSNGWQADVLSTLELELVDAGGSDPVVFGEDLAFLRFWAESDPDPAVASFDPASDLNLGSLQDELNGIRFEDLALAIPIGGRRIYVTADLLANPTDGRRLQLRIPELGIEMQSGNDGPRDREVVASAAHQISSSALLTSVNASPTLVSVGQQIEIRVAARNRGVDPLTGVSMQSLTPDPAGAVTLLSGPLPASFDLAPSAIDTFVYRFNTTQAGSVVFTAVVGDGTISSDPAPSPVVVVEQPATALSIDPLSNLPVSVNRGQGGVTPLIWQLEHPDPDPEAADIAVNAFTIHFEDGNGNPQSASAVMEQLEIRTGGLVHAFWSVIPAQQSLRIDLNPPVLLSAAEQRDLPLEVRIAGDAPVNQFQLRVSAIDAAEAIDVNSSSPVPLTVPDPWLSATARINTLAPYSDLDVESQLPASVNLGQAEIPLGRLEFSLPGAAGESEAKLVELRMAVRDENDVTIDPHDLFLRARVRSGGVIHGELAVFDTSGGAMKLPLTIPPLIVSGAPVSVELSADLRADTDIEQFQLVLVGSTAFEVRDSNTGTMVPVQLFSPPAYPIVQGPSRIQRPASELRVALSSGLPSSIGSGTDACPIATMTLLNPGAIGSADAVLQAVTLRLIDEVGDGLVPSEVFEAVRLFIPALGNQVVASLVGLPQSGSSFVLSLATPLRIPAGGSVELGIDGDLRDIVPSAWLRVALDGGAFGFIDGNDPTRMLGVSEGLPFATSLMRIVTQPAAAAVGFPGEPPVNIARGASGVSLMELRIEHPGNPAEGSIRPAFLSLRLSTIAGTPLAVEGILTAARLETELVQLVAVLAADSLQFDLSALGDLEPGELHALDLVVDTIGAPTAEDFKLSLDADGLVAMTGAELLPVLAAAQSSLPYLSEAVHLLAADLGTSFSNYPNPFAAGRENTNITFQLPAPGRVTLEIYTVTGELVRRLLDGEPLEAGLHDGASAARLAWDGRNGDGRTVRNGAYLLRIAVEGQGEFVRKLGVLR